MKIDYLNFIHQATKLAEKNISAVCELLNAGATVPFIVRYRRDKIGANLTEKDVVAIRDNLTNFETFTKRYQAIIDSLEKRDLLDKNLLNKLNECTNINDLEAVYFPFKESRQNRMAKAIALGLEPIANEIMAQKDQFIDFFAILGHRGLSIDEINSGVTDIIAAKLASNNEVIEELRNYYEKTAILECQVKKNCDEKKAQLYKNYFDFSKKFYHLSSHQYLAISRGVNEKLLRIKTVIDTERCIKIIRRITVENHRAYYTKLFLAGIDECFKRYVKPMLERELINTTKERADLTAIEVFTTNLQQLLLTTPLGEKTVLALDPGFTNGVKFAIINEVGKLLYSGKIFPFKDATKSTNIIKDSLEKYSVKVIALGNGTASNETMNFLKSFIKDIPIIVVDECGASIYSVTECAVEEFPELDSTLRSAVSIGRRLQNPLAELVKIPVESLGVGQYQHDVNNKLLKKSLDDEVIHCVNKHGVNLNLASKELLQYVSGLNATTAKNIVSYREQHGHFKNREQLKKITRFGAKSFEQSSGFLKILNGNNLLDATCIHPESYSIAQQIYQLMVDEKLDKDCLRNFKNTYGAQTVDNITNELKLYLKEDDYEFDYSKITFEKTVHSFSELIVGDKISGKVVNITNFGAFIDVGIHENGFIHISNIADEFIENINDYLKLNQLIEATIIEIDKEKNKFALSLKKI
ncbi:Tex-like N-terminal domain-containing protein [Lentisphaerota bacterium WC36G]|nr:helix-hairpin-helix domain-containing protein [Lentisphaerae bacterium WC36]